jgi:hypothetical protein
VAHTDDKRRGRLNIITHLLSMVPYERQKTSEIELPKRQPASGYSEPNRPISEVPTVF